MESLKGFCINCSDKVEVYLDSRYVEYFTKDVRINYTEKVARCKRCGEEVYVPKVNDMNVVARRLAYRKSAVSKSS